MTTDEFPNTKTTNTAQGRKKRGFEKIGEVVSIYRRGEMWYANYQFDARQQRKSLNTKSLKEARRRAIRLEAEISEGRFKQRTEVATIAEAVKLYKEFLRTEKRAAKTINKYDRVLGAVLSLAEVLKIKTVDRLNLGFIDKYRAIRVKSKKADKTVYNESTIIRQLVNFALSRDLVFQDPMKGLRLKKPKATEQPCWKLAEVRQIIEASPEEIRPALTILANTGLRVGELAWLTWADVDFKNNFIWVRPKDDWRPKTGDRRRIPLSQEARAELEKLPRSYRWVTTMPPTKKYPKPGRQWTQRRLLSALQRVLKKLGLPGKLHTFRHFFISNALLQGIPVATVRSWVGHVDHKIIEHYTHVDHDASQTAMQRLSDANSQSADEGDVHAGAEDETDPAHFQHTMAAEKGT